MNYKDKEENTVKGEYTVLISEGVCCICGFEIWGQELNKKDLSL